MVLIAIVANAQAVIAEIDWTQESEYTYWCSGDNGSTAVVGAEGLEINVPTAGENVWNPQAIVLNIPGQRDAPAILAEDGHYVVVIKAKHPSGHLQVNLGSWDDGVSLEKDFDLEEATEFEDIIVDLDDWPVDCFSNVHVLWQCGTLPGLSVLKKIQIIDLTNSNYDTWTIAGDKNLLGSDWDATDKKNEMSTYDGINYTLTKAIELSEGSYQFKVYKDAMQESYPRNNATLVINEKAFYNVKFTFNSNSKELSATATKKEVLFYNFIPKGKVAEVKSIAYGFKGDLTIPSVVTHEGETYTVNKIGDRAFSNCRGLTSVNIPNSVTTIGNSAFYECSGLASVTIPSNVTAIGESAFCGCSKLSSITIPNNVSNIENSTFSNCNSLMSMKIPNSVTTIGNFAFSGCGGLSSVTIPNSVATIGSSAFGGCSGLSSVTIPNSVTTIGSSAFSGCSKLSSVTIPNTVMNIDSYTFFGCSSLTSVNIPNSVTSIGYSAFSGCKGLVTVTIPNSVTSIGSDAFYSCTSLTSVNIPSSVTSLSGFSGCTGLTSITIPSSVTSINGSAFRNCTGLTSVTIPNSVSWINEYAFAGCSKLKSVTIGNNVNSISSGAFANCSELTDVYCMVEKLSNEQWSNEGLYTAPDAFNESYIEYATLHVPAAALNNYKNTEPWKKFQNKIALDSGDIPETPKCDKPEISYENGRVKFTCKTEGVEYISDVVLADQHKYYDAEIQLSQTYKISVYAAKAGYDNSDVTTREIVITGNGKAIVVGDVDGDGKVNVADHVKLSDIIMEKK